VISIAFTYARLDIYETIDKMESAHSSNRDLPHYSAQLSSKSIALDIMTAPIENNSSRTEEAKDMGHLYETNVESGPSEDHLREEQYPPTKVVIPVVLCLYSAFFLVALVSSEKQSTNKYLTFEQ